jgi:hypothetical protein
LRRRLALTAAAIGMVGAASPFLAPVAGPGPVGSSPLADTSTVSPPLSDDPRVQSFLQAYGALLDSVTYLEDDAVFSVRGRAIYFQDGRMVGDHHLGEPDEFESIFYRYPLEWLTEPLPLTDEPVYCTDFMDYLFGDTESEVRRHGQSVTFLDHRMFVNTILVEPLQAVEGEIRAAARRDPSVAKWIENLNITYSFIDRDIA